MATDRELLKRDEKGRASSLGLSDADGEVNKSHQETFAVRCLTDADGDFTYVLCKPNFRHRVISATYIPEAGLTADNSNYTTLTLEYDDGAGGADTTVATLNTKITGGTGDWSALVGEALTLDATKVIVEADQQYQLVGTKASAGVALPAGVLQLVVERV